MQKLIILQSIKGGKTKMFGERLKKLREARNITLEYLGKQVGKSAATLSRYENNLVVNWDPDFIEKLADILDTTPAYLLGVAENVHKEESQNDLNSVLITDDAMSPIIPKGSIVKVRPLVENEILQINSLYYIEFDGKKVFRLTIEDHEDGIGFLPKSHSERRIEYDPNYVTIIGKAVSMQVYFEDKIVVE